MFRYKYTQLPIIIVFLHLGVLSLAYSQPKAKMIVRDHLEREVHIPNQAERVLSLQPEITRIVVALGGRLVGKDYFMANQDYLFHLIYPEGKRLPVVSISSETVNMEMILKLRPDVIFASPSEFRVPEGIQRKTRIPVLALASMGRFDQLLEEIQMVGRILRREDRANELTGYFRQRLASIRQKIESTKVASDMTPQVYLSFWSSLTKTPIHYEPVDIAGGRNLGQGLLPAFAGSVGTAVNIEQIIKWDPDIILIHGSYAPAKREVTVENVLNDRRLRSLKAVQQKRVFYTFGFWYWWDPALVLTETLYLAKLFYPNLFRGMNIEEEGNAIFKKFYGLDKGYSSVCRILNCRDWSHD